MNTSWLDIFYNTFARTVNWMRSTTQRTPTTTILYCGHWKNKNQVNCFLILGWWVGKYPHSFGIETGIKIDVADGETFARTVHQTTTTKTLTATILYSSTPHRWAQGLWSRMYRIYYKKKFWERLGLPLEFHVYVLVGEITIPIGLLKRPTPSASGC